MNTGKPRALSVSARRDAALPITDKPSWPFAFSVFICVHLCPMVSRPRHSLSFELGLALFEEGLVADLEVLGAEAGEALVVFLLGERAAAAQPALELLVPARHQRRAFGDALGGGTRLGLDLGIRDDARDQSLLLRLARVEDPALEQDLESVRLSREHDQRADLGVGHHQAELVDRHAEAARLAADADVGEARDLQAAADADAVDLGDDRMRAARDRLDPVAHDRAIGARLLDVGALGGELRDVVARRERLRALATNHDAAQRVVVRQLVEYLAQALPHRPREGVELLGAIEDHRGDRAIALHQDSVGRGAHRRPIRASARPISGQKSRASASARMDATRPFDQNTVLSPLAPIIDSRNESSARLPRTMARVSGASGMLTFLKT